MIMFISFYKWFGKYLSEHTLIFRFTQFNIKPEATSFPRAFTKD